MIFLNIYLRLICSFVSENSVFVNQHGVLSYESMTQKLTVALIIFALLGAGCPSSSSVPPYVPGEIPTEAQLESMTDEEKMAGMEAMMEMEPPEEMAAEEQTRERTESIERMRDGTTERFGEFEGRFLHPANGNVRVIEEEGRIRLVFSDDFSVLPGPALYVYLSAESNPQSAGAVMNEGHEIAKLKSANGVQIYELPEGIDLTDIHSIVVVCKPFKFIFASAGF
jgi:hypothetical protein